MRASVIIRTKDEADRLRLTLASLEKQTVPCEVVVMDDGSRDHTAAVLAVAGAGLSIVPLRHEEPQGRSAASNAAAHAASGDILIFLDGDTLAAPDFVEKHLAAHRAGPGVVARGETRHLRCTRFFADPEKGTPRAGEEERVARLRPSELATMLVTCDEVRQRFDTVHARSQLGIYPGAGPRDLYDLEMDALRAHTSCATLWAAASGSNQSVERAAFLDAGGFDPRLSINEHRELALRLTKRGLRMRAADGARSYHLTHRSGWCDPALDRDWEETFYERHPEPAVALLSILWASLASPSPVPREARITTLPALAEAAAACGVAGSPDKVRDDYLRTRRGAVETAS